MTASSQSTAGTAWQQVGKASMRRWRRSSNHHNVGGESSATKFLTYDPYSQHPPLTGGQ